MTVLKTTAILSIAAAALAACSSTPVAPAAKPAAITAAPVARVTPAPSAMPAPTPQSTVATVTLPDYLDPRSPLSSARSVFFDFDQAALKGDDTTVIERHGKYLSSHPQLAIRVEGNTDERGSAEYNLALGQKRAVAVVKALEVYGVKDTQLEAVSWGEEKPRAQGHDESAWAQNRRADLQYPQR
jgi:peptidoglycan-associated lipoprotein